MRPSDIPEVRTCADCGETLITGRPTSTGEPRWAHPDFFGGILRSMHYWCRFTRNRQGYVDAIDFHYVEGETQKHWRRES